MRIRSIALFALTLALVACSDNRENEKVGVAATPAPSAAPVRFERDLPTVFRGLPSEDGGRCAVDIVNKLLTADEFTIGRAEGFTIYGWALDEKNGSVPPFVVLQLAGQANSYYAPLIRRNDRDDLSKAFGKAEFKNAGFGAVVDIAALPVGKYEVRIIQKGDKTITACATRRIVTIVD